MCDGRMCSGEARLLLKAVGAVAATIALVSAASIAGASPVVLTDGNSLVQIDPYSDAGMFSWTVHGIEHLARQWFWYRVGGSGGEQALSTLTLAATNLTDGNGDGVADTLFLRYTGADLRVDITYALTGGGTNTYVSDIIENIRLVNTSGTTKTFHFFQYSDFNLNNTATDDTVSITGGNTATQIDGGGTFVGETVVTPRPSFCQAGTAAGLLQLLADGSPTTLSGQASAGPDDVAWAFQWDAILGNGSSLIISKDKQIVPEPATLAMLTLGVGAGMLRRYRRTI